MSHKIKSPNIISELNFTVTIYPKGLPTFYFTVFLSSSIFSNMNPCSKQNRITSFFSVLESKVKSSFLPSSS